jgi:hypothetical protein
LAPQGRFEVVQDVPHDFWALNPETWVSTVEAALAQA